MDNKLREYFPLIRTREELLAEIESKPELNKTFRNWKYEYQEEFLDFCTGEHRKCQTRERHLGSGTRNSK